MICMASLHNGYISFGPLNSRLPIPALVEGARRRGFPTLPPALANPGRSMHPGVAGRTVHLFSPSGQHPCAGHSEGGK